MSALVTHSSAFPRCLSNHRAISAALPDFLSHLNPLLLPPRYFFKNKAGHGVPIYMPSLFQTKENSENRKCLFCLKEHLGSSCRNTPPRPPAPPSPFSGLLHILLRVSGDQTPFTPLNDTFHPDWDERYKLLNPTTVGSPPIILLSSHNDAQENPVKR